MKTKKKGMSFQEHVRTGGYLSYWQNTLWKIVDTYPKSHKIVKKALDVSRDINLLRCYLDDAVEKETLYTPLNKNSIKIYYSPDGDWVCPVCGDTTDFEYLPEGDFVRIQQLCPKCSEDRKLTE